MHERKFFACDLISISWVCASAFYIILILSLWSSSLWALFAPLFTTIYIVLLYHSLILWRHSMSTKFKIYALSIVSIIFILPLAYIAHFFVYEIFYNITH